MPYVELEGRKIYWDEAGDGEPLLLIMGLGSASDMWYRLLPEFAERFRTIFFDNRGVGLSDPPTAPYSIADMADDAAAVMDAAGVESAHVIGFSMGGFIAQELALRHADRVRRLVLASTACGGSEVVWAAPEVLVALEAKTVKSREEGFWMTAPYNYHPSTPRALIEEDLSVTLRSPLRRESYQSQLQAIMTWGGSYSRLKNLRLPALVLHGDSDRLIPTENGRILARVIPRAELVLIEEAGHRFMTDKLEESARAILSFLEDAEARKQSAP
ncbi:MAG TPA: alpha/beta hydrolase [Pyrinomonadaceae bacterium]|nr:alpha/beta hydrolase [Pyrinomonadaceae bacterium]